MLKNGWLQSRTEKGVMGLRTTLRYATQSHFVERSPFTFSTANVPSKSKELLLEVGREERIKLRSRYWASSLWGSR